MNLLFLHASLQAGGAERTIALLSNYAAAQGNTVTIATMDNKDSFYQLHSAINHIRLNICGNSRGVFEALKNNAIRCKKVKEVVACCRPEVVICLGGSAILLSWLARGSMTYKIIGSERSNPYYDKTGFWNRQKRRISKLCDGFLFQTEGARKYYPGSTQKRGIILPNGILSTDFSELELPWEKRKNLCAVGRMDANKCFGDLITAFAKVYARHQNVQLDIYGDGVLRADLEKLVVSLGLQGAVIFHGRHTAILEQYAAHKIFAMTSRLEGLPNALLEALASGCACVATDCNFGPSELICDGENGFLVPVHDVDAMAEKLCLLLENDMLCSKISRNAISIRKTHDVNIVGENFCTYLRQL